MVSDKGVREVVLLNKARKIHFEEDRDPPRVWAESGSNFGAIARQAAQKGLAGLEWAAGIPGILGLLLIQQLQNVCDNSQASVIHKHPGPQF